MTYDISLDIFFDDWYLCDILGVDDFDWWGENASAHFGITHITQSLKLTSGITAEQYDNVLECASLILR